MRLAVRLRQLRLAAGLTLRGAAAALGMGQSFLGTVEADRQRMPPHRFPKVAEVYRVDAAELAAHLRDEVLADRLRAMAADLAAAGHLASVAHVLAAVAALPQEHLGPSIRARAGHAIPRDPAPLGRPSPRAW